MTAERITERWTYLGERRGTANARLAVWRNEAGERRAFKPKARTRGIVGYVYTVTTDADGSLIGTPEWTGDQADDLLAIRLDDDTARAEFAAAGEQRKARERAELAGLLDAARAAAAGLTLTQKDALIEHVRRVVYPAK